ncbi:hypothetical protein B0H17DRAFT_1046611 [Mycena rosella]|uniref:Uncharacterized protein n=1 Tax=Mycena rosella TaxID=1033263 RepID=A0AAD7DYA3_MYCRO|nr:hypothetical protein B0H17DRAFT_1046611 [Mycena rosella]
MYLVGPGYRARDPGQMRLSCVRTPRAPQGVINQELNTPASAYNNIAVPWHPTAKGSTELVFKRDTLYATSDAEVAEM